ncbi:patatin-like phospholipase/acyl hydrolase [Lewinella aquimaris]|uniref:Patatin-like phospholipase/acyl hydrolase n=1 Tax=Neolewinella aquimaris TaxID=1835722 RepID=A0A840EB23_9BACT|nr:patatin-like phospholipase family protein [Neolewinella aquimaris]MBB4081143.1 patatin-like phospholipase/acyl hydrolase [Neolewinella aquimaris]
MRRLRVLSIDGGGLRGVIPLQVIKYIEKITGKQIHQIFDVVAGTSTGALLTCAILIEDENNVVVGQRLYSADTIQEIYTLEGKAIFPRLNTFRRFQSIYQPSYKADSLDNTLDKYFGSRRISDCLLPVFITAYDIHREKPVYFTTREANLDPYKNSLLTEVCRASSAAPTYFPTFAMDYEREKIHCIDGGIFMNNPSFGVLSEILANIDSKYYQVDFINGLSQIHLLSIGTGSSTGNLDSQKAKNWGKFQWARPVIDLAMRGPVEVTDQHLQVLFQLHQSSSNYLRVNVSLEDSKTDMANSSDAILDYWIQATNSQITQNETARLHIRSFLEDSGVEIIE